MDWIPHLLLIGSAIMIREGDHSLWFLKIDGGEIHPLPPIHPIIESAAPALWIKTGRILVTRGILKVVRAMAKIPWVPVQPEGPYQAGLICQNQAAARARPPL